MVQSRHALCFALVLVALGVSAGCGGGEDSEGARTTAMQTTEGEPAGVLPGDSEAGGSVFAAAGCGGCHTLEASGSGGTTGPNLDEAQPSLEKVVERVTNGAPGMPSFAGQLTDDEIRDVAAYVVESTES